jgi:hypothetical protein
MSKHDDMVRTQIQLEAPQYERLKRVAARRGVSMARLVREGVDAVLAAEDERDPWDDLFSVVGKYGGDGPSEDVALEHDRYLEEIYGEWLESS